MGRVRKPAHKHGPRRARAAARKHSCTAKGGPRPGERVPFEDERGTVRAVLAERSVSNEFGIVEHQALVDWEGGSFPTPYVQTAIRNGYRLCPGYPQPDPEHPGQLLAEWEPAREPLNVLIDGDHVHPALATYRAGSQVPALRPDKRAPHELRDIERTRPRPWREPYRPDPGRTMISTREVNPDSDVHPMGAHRLLQEHQDGDTTLVHCYTPAGRRAGSLTLERAQHLWRRWVAARPGGQTDAHPTWFAEDVARLLARYTSKDMTNHWATPRPLLEALATASIRTESLSEPGSPPH